MKRRIFSVLLSSALLLTALAGCGQGGEADPSGSPSDAESETATRDELIFVNYRDIRDLNPHLYAGEMYAQSILYDTLVSNTEDGYVGCLAEDWTISDDGRIYTFNIRDGVTFSDGTPCDANAILANFNAILENRERHTWLEMMNLLVSVSAPDSDTFVIEMSEPYYPMLTELACIRPFAMISPTQVQVMDLLQDLKEKLGLTYVFITHDLTSITYLCDDVLFLYQGRVTEYLPVSRISETKDEYARRLLESIVVFDTETSEVAV